MKTGVDLSVQSSSNMVECTNVTVVLGQREIVSDASCSIPKNALTFIVGENGSGKTSLVRGMLGLIPISSGEILFHTYEGRTPEIGYVPQNIEFPKQFQMTVTEYLNYSALVPSDSVIHVLSRVDFPESHIGNLITELSGGQIQKLLLAAELFRDLDILFLDEPLSNVDDSSEKHIIDVIMGIKNQGVSIVIITHDWNMVSKYANHVICLNKNFLCETSSSCICRHSLSQANIKSIQKATADPDSRHDGYCYIENIE